MAASLPIGHLITLISKSEVRYVGTLYSLDSEKVTVTLAKGRLNLSRITYWACSSIHNFFVYNGIHDFLRLINEHLINVCADSLILSL